MQTNNLSNNLKIEGNIANLIKVIMEYIKKISLEKSNKNIN